MTVDPGQRDPRRWQFLGVLLAGVFMAILDVFIVNVAAPDIQEQLGTDAGTLELIVASYTLAYAMVLITGARLGDDHGHRRFYLLGVALSHSHRDHRPGGAIPPQFMVGAMSLTQTALTDVLAAELADAREALRAATAWNKLLLVHLNVLLLGYLLPSARGRAV